MLFWEGHAALDAGSVVSKWPSAMGPSGSALVAEKSLTQVIHIASGAEVRAKGRPSWLMGVILNMGWKGAASCLPVEKVEWGLGRKGHWKGDVGKLPLSLWLFVLCL